MNKKPKNIEQLYSENFNDFRIEPSSDLWKSISSKLAWRNFFSFSPTTLNAYYVAGILTLATAGALLLTKPAIENNPETQEITINNTIENAVITPMQENEVESKETTTKVETQQPALSSEVLTKKGSSIVVSAKADTQKLSSSAIVTTKIETQESISSIKHISPSNQNPEPSTHELATPHPKPKTQNPLNSKLQAPSSKLPDPWPNIDSLFTNNTPTPPQHTIQFPNAFTPNANGPTNGYYTPGIPNNDVFHPEYKGVMEYHLSIFNRRGELIFESKNINTGWDGYINNRLAAQGVYIWKARGKYSNGKNFIKAGNVMLIKK